LTSPSGSSYIGQSIDIDRRFRHYRHNPHKGQKILYRAIIKYGFDSFNKEILIEFDTIDKDVLNFYETKFIKEHNTISPNGYNLNFGGDSRIPSEESKKNMRNAQLGRKHPESVKEKIRLSHVGKKFSELHLLNMSLCKLGKKCSPESYHKKYGHRIIGVLKFDKNMNFLESYESIVRASKDNNIHENAIRNCLHKRTKTSGGFIWKMK